MNQLAPKGWGVQDLSHVWIIMFRGNGQQAFATQSGDGRILVPAFYDADDAAQYIQVMEELGSYSRGALLMAVATLPAVFDGIRKDRRPVWGRRPDGIHFPAAEDGYRPRDVLKV